MSVSSSLAPLLTNTLQYRKLATELQKCSEPEQKALARSLCLTDLYFLLWFALGRHDVEHDWVLERCKEVQEHPDGYLDLWAREHYKSTIITFALTIQDILKDPEVTIGIFSHTRPIAKKFLRQIKREFEKNVLLKELFPEVLWRDPDKESPKWSEDDGIIVKRKSNPGESTVEAWGLVDGQPTGKHFTRLVYDDVVTDKSVTTPDMIEKTTDALGLSYNLGAVGGKIRFIGTRYHFNDTYKTVIDRGTAMPRTYAATKNGEPTGEPVLFTREAIAKKRRDQGPYIFACQMLQNPKGDEKQGFQRHWIRYADPQSGKGMNKYIIVDPASSKKKGSDYTAMWVIGLSGDENYYQLEAIRDRLSLTERAQMLMDLHRKWRPLNVGYEEYGLQADIEHIKYKQEKENYRFDITPLGGKLSKIDRIRKLIPIFEQKRVYLLRSQFKTNHEGKTVDLVDSFINEEYLAFPVAEHDDMLDSLARILEEDMKASWPTKSDDFFKKINFESRGIV